MSDRPSRDHYSYTVYADRATARTFDERRFGGPIGELVAASQAQAIERFIGRLHDRTILDVGTGTGRAALLFARRGARVTGIDASNEMLAVARDRAAEDRLSIDFRVGDAHKLDVPDRAFDTAVSLRVLMHTPRWQQCVSELCRVADRMVILDYPAACSAALVHSAGRRAWHALGGRTEPYRVFTDRQIADGLARSGFRVRSMHRQFVLPIAFHKALGSPRVTLAIEAALGRVGLLRILGSPVTIAAERCASS